MSGPVFAVMMVKDEADIICQNIRNLSGQGVDHAIVADNNSTDGTTEHLREFERGGFVTYHHDPQPGYYQAAKTQRLVDEAGERGAAWILVVDADELWYSPTGQPLAQALRSSRLHVYWAEGFYQLPHVDDDLSELDPVRRMRWRRAGRDCPESKVCFRYVPTVRVHPGNHDVDHPAAQRGHGLVAFREFQYRSFEHFVRKVRNGKAAYDAAPDLHPLLGIHWKEQGAKTDDELAQAWAEYLATPAEFDPAPMLESAHA